MPKVRLYLDHPFAAGEAVPLSPEQGHYLGSVMRLAPGAAVAVFNGRDGEWEAEVEAVGKRGAVRLRAHVRPQATPPDLWLLFAPIKKARTDFIVEKACEMGARRILPVQTERTNSERINAARLRLHAVEAAEQCGGTFVPEVADLQPLARALDSLNGRRLWFCDEALAEGVAPTPVATGDPGAVLVGPEGGFTDAERARLGAVAEPVRLGPRILRADTAAVAALALWQATEGDWR
jgi:16S rRNA (uracil1498-N3)-methyltransferase